MDRLKRYPLFCLAGLLLFVVATVGSSTLARVIVVRMSLLEAFFESIHYIITNPLGAFTLAVPFIVSGFIAAAITRRAGIFKGCLLFMVFSGILCWVYFQGYMNAQQALVEHEWTASALSIGLLPLQSLPILVIQGIFASLIYWRESSE